MNPRLEKHPPESWKCRVFPWVKAPQLAPSSRLVCYHEAGHAAVSRALGLPTHGARIDVAYGGFSLHRDQDLMNLNSDRDSSCISRDADFMFLHATLTRPGCNSSENTLDLVTMLQAGRQAELIAEQVPWPGLLVEWNSDTLQSRELLAEQFSSITALAWCQLRARALLSEHWNEVEDIAATLIENGEWFSKTVAA